MNWSELRALAEQLGPLAPVAVVLLAALAVVLLSLRRPGTDTHCGRMQWAVCPAAALAGCVLALVALAANYAQTLRSTGAPPPWLADAGAPAAGASALILQGAFAVDGFGMAVALVALLAGLLAVLCAASTPRRPRFEPTDGTPHPTLSPKGRGGTTADSARQPIGSGEFYGLVLLAVAGMMLLGFAHDFLTLLVSLEIMAVATYVLAGAERETERSTEAALKYLVLGAFSTAFLLLGIAFFFGATGRFTLAASAMSPGEPRFYLALAGLALILAGILFKVGAVPFHFWVPDVYEGAPTPVTILMAVGVKAAAFGVAARLFFGTFGAPEFVARMQPLLVAAAVATMLLGNLVAMHQRSVKRMLAYSALAHTGYLLLAFLVAPGSAGPPTAALNTEAIAFYLLGYAVMTGGAFAVTALTREDGRPLEEVDDYRGLARERPALALSMACFMVSLAGLPPLVGFFAKFAVFRAAIAQGFVAPAVLGILASVASLYYYLGVVRAMYMAPQEESPPARRRPSRTARVLIYGAALATLALGLFPPDLAGRVAAPSRGSFNTEAQRTTMGETEAGGGLQETARTTRTTGTARTRTTRTTERAPRPDAQALPLPITRQSPLAVAVQSAIPNPQSAITSPQSTIAKRQWPIGNRMWAAHEDRRLP